MPAVLNAIGTVATLMLAGAFVAATKNHVRDRITRRAFAHVYRRQQF